MIWDYAANGNPDALLQRQRPTLDERLAALLDANFNTIAVADDESTIVERYAYQSFGSAEFYDGTFEPLAESSFGWDILFAGYRMDRVTGLFYVRNRFYSSPLGRWITRDPIGEPGGYNLYGFVSNDPINLRDSSGLSWIQEGAPKVVEGQAWHLVSIDLDIQGAGSMSAMLMSITGTFEVTVQVVCYCPETGKRIVKQGVRTVTRTVYPAGATAGVPIESNNPTPIGPPPLPTALPAAIGEAVAEGVSQAVGGAISGLSGPAQSLYQELINETPTDPNDGSWKDGSPCSKIK
jgi:RHS repeat-associated protein